MAVSSVPFLPSQPRPRPPRETPDYVIDVLKAAILANDKDVFLAVLSVQTRIFELWEVMDTAVACDHAAAAFELLRRGMPVSYFRAESAVRCRAKNCLAVFLDFGLDINALRGSVDPSVFAYAVDDRDLALWLLDRGADLNKQPEWEDITPLSFAARFAAPDLLQELLDRGGDVQKGEVLQNALDRTTDDVVAVLGILLDKGAPLDAVQYANHPGSLSMYYGMERGTPLCKAAGMGNVEAVRYLLERGADASIRNSKGRTARECAERKGFQEIVDMLADE